MVPRALSCLQRDSWLSWSWKCCPRCLQLFQREHRHSLSVKKPVNCYHRWQLGRLLSMSAWRMRCGSLWRCRSRNCCKPLSKFQNLLSGSSSSRCRLVIRRHMSGLIETGVAFESGNRRMAVITQFGKSLGDVGTLCLPFRWLSKGDASLSAILVCVHGGSLFF
jgi:hypothetical protein